MKHVAYTFLMTSLLTTSALAADLKPLPDMSSAKVSSADAAAKIVLKPIIANAKDGLAATESVVGMLSFTLGADYGSFGKKGDRVWQVHRIRDGEVISILLVNAETESVVQIYPQRPARSYTERFHARHEELKNKAEKSNKISEDTGTSAPDPQD